ncbi:unnamed protein product [Boreogadus saida]
MAADYGRPRREFFRLLMLEVQSSLGIFEGRPGELFFAYYLQALDQNKFFTAGKLTARSIIHNGPGLRCLNYSLFALMCSQEVDLTKLDLALVQIENENQSKIDQVTLKANFHWIRHRHGTEPSPNRHFVYDTCLFNF